MQEQFFTQFIQLFKQVFLQNLDGSFSLFSGYASGLFYGLATLELVIAGLLIAMSSSTTIYTLLTRLIKISIFFFLVFHFDDIFQLFLNSITYISAHTQTNAGSVISKINTFKLSDLWNFKNPSNYVTQGLSQIFNSFSSLHTTFHTAVQNNLAHMNNAAQMDHNSLQPQTTGLSGNNNLLDLGQTIVLALTAILAMINMILFYFTALIALLLSPFGQLSISRGIFQAAFSKFIGAGLRLVTFTIVFILFSLFYTKLSQAVPNLLPSSAQPTLNVHPLGNNTWSQVHSLQPTSLVSFLMALLGLCLCWIIPKEISQRAGSFIIPEPPQESALPVPTPQSTAPSTTTSSPLQAYTSTPSAQTTLALQTAIPTVSPSLSPPSQNIHVAGTQVTTHVTTGSVVSGGNNMNKAQVSKSSETLRKQTGLTQKRFSQERAARLRQNFHSAMEKNEK